MMHRILTRHKEFWILLKFEFGRISYLTWLQFYHEAHKQPVSRLGSALLSLFTSHLKMFVSLKKFLVTRFVLIWRFHSRHGTNILHMGVNFLLGAPLISYRNIIETIGLICTKSSALLSSYSSKMKKRVL